MYFDLKRKVTENNTDTENDILIQAVDRSLFWITYVILIKLCCKR